MSEVFQPMPFQPGIVRWLKEHDSCAIWAGMGMGKTACTLTAISELILEGSAKGALIICPHRVGPLAWAAQIERWEHLNWLRIANMRTEEGAQAWEDGSCDIFWINSERLPSTDRKVKGRAKHYPGFVERFITKRKALPVDIFVWDEVSQAKNHKSVRANAIRGYLHDSERYKTKFKYRWGLTGTPHSNSYLDVFAPTRLLDNGKRLGKSFFQFRSCWFDSDFMGFVHIIKDGAKEKIDAKLADFALVLRSEDHLDLPETTIIDVDVTLPGAAMTAYRELEKSFLLQVEEGDIEALSAAALTTKLLQLTCGCVYLTEGNAKSAVLHDAKIKALRKIRKDHISEPLLVVAHYKHERRRLLEEFPEAREFHERDVPAWQRGEIPMWIAQSAQISHGIDGLQDSGRIIVWVTPTWSWETYTQLIHRLVRPGQKHETLVYRLLCKDTIDWAVAGTLEEKKEGERGLMAAIHALQQLRKTQ